MTLNNVKRLSYLTQLFPLMFNEKLCEQLLEMTKKMIQYSIQTNRGNNFLAVAKTGETEQKISTVIEIFHQIPAATPNYVVDLVDLILSTEKVLVIEPSCPYRTPLVKFLKRYPKETIDLLLNDNNIKDPQYNRFLIYLLEHKEGELFKNEMENRADRLIELILKTYNQRNQFQNAAPLFTAEEEYEAQHQAVLIIYTLIQLNGQWLTTQYSIVQTLKTFWGTDLHLAEKEQNIVCDLWHLVAKILLHYFEQNTNDIDLLFQLLNALCLRFIPDFQVCFLSGFHSFEM
jgi:transformation/transcription domain-associated protein